MRAVIPAGSLATLTVEAVAANARQLYKTTREGESMKISILLWLTATGCFRSNSSRQPHGGSGKPLTSTFPTLTALPKRPQTSSPRLLRRFSSKPPGKITVCCVEAALSQLSHPWIASDSVSDVLAAELRDGRRRSSLLTPRCEFVSDRCRPCVDLLPVAPVAFLAVGHPYR
jgi:hypothetical protein